MKAKQIFILIFTLSLVILLSACGGVKGIDSPLEVGEVQIQITSAELQDTLDLGSQTLRPSSAGDVILSVTSSTSTENPAIEVSVTDENGRSDTPSVTQSTTSEGKSTLSWYFGVSKSAKSFTLHLPGEVAVPLDSVLGK